MLVSEVGEFGLIDRIAALLNKKGDNKAASWSNLVVGIGDDAAAWRSTGETEVATTDILVEGVHFNFNLTAWKDLGWKALAINISDISAMGGRPQYALVSLALPGKCRVSDVLNLYEGILEIANAYGVTIAGGNISESEKVVVNIALTGVVHGTIMKRSAAKPGDLVAVFGYPGLSAAGLHILHRKKKLDAAARELFVNAHIHPNPGFDKGPKLAAAGVGTAIDISDGLAADLRHICESSGVSAVIHTEQLPVHPLLKKYFPRSYLKMALSGGEDYLLLFTAPRPLMNKISRIFKPAPAIIGEITRGRAGEVHIVNEKGRQVDLNYAGWEHYREPHLNG